MASDFFSESIIALSRVLSPEGGGSVIIWFRGAVLILPDGRITAVYKYLALHRSDWVTFTEHVTNIILKIILNILVFLLKIKYI